MNKNDSRMADGCIPLVKKAAFGAGALLLTSASACTVSTSSDVVAVAAGPLIIDWTIEGTKDPSFCAVGNATVIDITISGPTSGGFQADCTAFATSISSLVQGSYTANALLLGPSGEDRTTEIQTPPFVMTSASLTIPVDFPADSFR